MFLNNIQIIENGKFLTDIKKEGKYTYFVFDDKTKLMSTAFIKKRVNIMCCKCGILRQVSFYHGLIKKPYSCISCNMAGSNNPFYGKHHSNESKEKMGGAVHDYNGANNPFYGKHHTEQNKEHYRELFSEKFKGAGNPFYGKKHSELVKKKMRTSHAKWMNSLSDVDKIRISEKASNLQKYLLNTNPADYKNKKSKAARASHVAQFKNCRMNKIEKIVNNELLKNNLDTEYSVIFCNKQFDFGIKNKKILIEVHGDYWHANPKIYGNGLKAINKTQKNKTLADIEKRRLAEKYGFKLYIIWESDILAGNFSSLKEIL